MFRLFMADDQIRFISTHNVEWCIPDEKESVYSLLQETNLLDVMTQIAFVGLMFTVYTAVDLFVALIHGLAGIEYIIHHMAFIVAGILLRSNCMLPFNAAILISMEISNLPLNYMCFFRHREGFDQSVKISSVLFVISFFAFRILFNTYGAVFLLWHEDQATPVWVPAWQQYFLTIAIVVGAILQFWWGRKVIQSMIKAYGGTDSRDEDGGYTSLSADVAVKVNQDYKPPTLLVPQEWICDEKKIGLLDRTACQGV
jgi:hypothetical protein